MTPLQTKYYECYQDKSRIKLIENFFTTYDATCRKTSQFILFPRQKAFLNALSTGNEVIAIKHRQAGITTISAAWIAGQCAFSKPESPETILCIANQRGMAEELLDKIIGFIDQIPRWMWGPDYYSPDKNNEKNKRSIYVKQNKAEFELFNGCKGYARSAGKNASRGISAVSILIFDEAAFIENPVEVYSAATAATSSVMGAKTIMVSTPNGKDLLYYKTYSQALSHENNFTAVEFKWFQDLRYNRHLQWYKKNEETGEVEWITEPVVDNLGNIPYDEEKWRKLENDGWKATSPWYVKMCKKFNNDSRMIAQELEVSFLGSSDNVVAPDVIEYQRDKNVIKIDESWPLRDPLTPETWIWEDPNPSHRYILACLPYGEKVLTSNGLKEINEVSKDDELINKDGEFVQIKNFMQRPFNGSVYSVKLKNIIDPIKFTGNHPIWSSKNTKLIRGTDGKRRRIFNFKFNETETLNIGDWVEYPNIYHKKTLTFEEIAKKWEKYENIGRIDFSVNNPLCNSDFWYYCGMWLAEGWCYKNKNGLYTISTAHNKNELRIHNKISSIVKDVFKRNATVNKNKKENGLTILFNSKQIGAFLEDTFGKYAKYKFISEWVKFIPDIFKYSLIEGYFDGDGCVNKNYTSDYVSISKRLLNDIQDILFSLGIVSSLKKHNDEHCDIIEGRTVCCNPKYYLHIGKHDNAILMKGFSEKYDIPLIETRRKISNCYLSEDLNSIYIQISNIEIEKYDGYVYNFETETHTFCCRGVATHNCDPSSGSGEDSTSIQVIDCDAVDETGTPYFNQVLEYNGKRTGDEIAVLIDRYGRVYNNALVVVEDIGGWGSACLLSLRNMKYPNLYYDESALKKYTDYDPNRRYSNVDIGRTPGFKTNSVRPQMLSNFAAALTNNTFRVRSMRVINELDTWIWKNGRPDHMTGFHDDSITCLAMGLFVMEFYMFKKIKDAQKDAKMIHSWRSSATIKPKDEIKPTDDIDISKPRKLPIYSSYQLNKQKSNRVKAFIMLGGFKTKKST